MQYDNSSTLQVSFPLPDRHTPDNNMPHNLLEIYARIYLLFSALFPALQLSMREHIHKTINLCLMDLVLCIYAVVHSLLRSFPVQNKILFDFLTLFSFLLRL